MTKIFRIIDFFFWLFLISLLVGGVIIVGGQLIGVFGLSQNLVVQSSEIFGPWAFASATLCGVCAFLMRYRPKTQSEDPS